MPLRLLVVPEVWADQLAPPSLVCTIVPDAPMAHPLLEFVKEISYKVLELPDAWVDHLAPPSLVNKMVPNQLHAQPLLPSFNLI